MDEVLERGRNWLAGVVVVAALGAAVALAVPLVQRPAAPPVQLVTAPSGPPAAAEIQVHVVGAVQQPGLYALPAGSRVGDAVQAAGAGEDADLAALNLAARLSDGQRLAVPRQGEPASSAASSGSGVAARPRQAASAAGGSSPVNLNAAGAAELDALPGIGPTLAGRIVAYRDQYGPFTSVQQLREARLVPAATFERIRDLVTVE